MYTRCDEKVRAEHVPSDWYIKTSIPPHHPGRMAFRCRIKPLATDTVHLGSGGGATDENSVDFSDFLRELYAIDPNEKYKQEAFEAARAAKDGRPSNVVTVDSWALSDLFNQNVPREWRNMIREASKSDKWLWREARFSDKLRVVAPSDKDQNVELDMNLNFRSESHYHPTWELELRMEWPSDNAGSAAAANTSHGHSHDEVFNTKRRLSRRMFEKIKEFMESTLVSRWDTSHIFMEESTSPNILSIMYVLVLDYYCITIEASCYTSKRWREECPVDLTVRGWTIYDFIQELRKHKSYKHWDCVDDPSSFQHELQKRELALFMYNHSRLGHASKLKGIDPDLLRQLVLRRHVTMQISTKELMEELQHVEDRRQHRSEIMEQDVYTSDVENSSSSSDEEREDIGREDHGSEEEDEAGSAAWPHYSSDEDHGGGSFSGSPG